jgi:hypothetical protein
MIPIFVAGKPHDCKFPAQAAHFPRMNEKSALLQARIDFAYSLLWFALDALWMLGFTQWTAASGILTGIIAIVALRFSATRTAKLMNVFALAWVAMDAAWLFGLMDITRSLALLALASGAMTVIRSLSRGERLVNTAMVCWIAMDVAQLAAECFDYSFIPAVEYAFCGLTVGFLSAG